MDVLNVRGGRNGLDSGYFSFVPVVVGAASTVGVVSKSRKARKTKYANIETQKLAEKYPLQDKSTDQKLILEQILRESSATLEQRNKSKGKKRAELTGRLRAFDEYVADYQKHLQALLTEEAKAPIETPRLETPKETEVSTQTSVSPTQTAPQDGVLGTASLNKEGTTKQSLTPDTVELQSMVQGNTPTMGGKNTLLYVGLGLVALFIIIKLAKK